MEDLEKIFTSKNISESSKNLYLKNLQRLNGGEVKNFKFLKDIEGILEKLKDYKPNTQRSYIISIVSLLKTLSESKKGYKKLYDEYFLILDKMNKDLKDQTQKTDTEKENWIGQEGVKTKWCEMYDDYLKIKDKKKLSSGEYETLLHFLILSLFVLQKPRRNKDYQELYVVKKWKPEYGDKDNYLDLNRKEFFFNNYKTQGTYKTQKQDVDEVLMEIILTYLKHHPHRSQLRQKDAHLQFLVNKDGKPLEQINDITRILNGIFGRKIGSSMMRKLYLTDKYSDTLEQMEEDAKAMGTSANTIKNNYAKKDD